MSHAKVGNIFALYLLGAKEPVLRARGRAVRFSTVGSSIKPLALLIWRLHHATFHIAGWV